MAVEYVPGSNNDDGVNVGGSSGKIGFYGLAAPITKPAITAVGTATATTGLNETKIDRLYAALISLNLISTGG